jgi:hypothetical protein
VAEARWFRLDSNEELKEWKVRLKPIQRYAWLCLLQHVAATAPNQKRPGVAPALPLLVAVRLWEIDAMDVEVMLSHAQASGELIIQDGEWQITNKAHFVSERTLRQNVQSPDVPPHSSATDEVLPENTAEQCRTRQEPEKCGGMRKNAEPLSRDTHLHTHTNTHIAGKPAWEGPRAKPPGLLVEVAEEPLPPWWEGESSLAADVGRLVAERCGPDAVPEQPIRRLAEYARRVVPPEVEVEEAGGPMIIPRVEAALAHWASMPKSRRWADLPRSIKAWLERDEAVMRQVVAARRKALPRADRWAALARGTEDADE